MKQKRKIKGGGTRSSHITKGGAIGPALKIATAVGSGAIMASQQSSSKSFFYITYGFMFIILVLILWILYLIRDRKENKVNTKLSRFQSTGPLPMTTTTGALAYSSPPIPSVATASTVEVPLTLATKHDPFEDPHQPPLKNDGMYLPNDSSDVRGVPLIGSMTALLGFGDGPAKCNSGLCHTPPLTNQEPKVPGWPVNMMTRGYAPEFSQIGILTHERGGKGDNSLHDNMILPLFGRRIMNGRDKYQYYTMSNTGAVNTKLPVLVKNRSCIGEYGCDEISSGDTVYVQGYNNHFKATVYESSLFSYIPFL